LGFPPAALTFINQHAVGAADAHASLRQMWEQAGVADARIAAEHSASATTRSDRRNFAGSGAPGTPRDPSCSR